MLRSPLVHALAVALALDGAAAAARATPTSGTGGRTYALVADSLVGFRLRDQFGRLHDAAEYRGRALVLVGAARGGRAAATAWVETFRALQHDSVGAVPVLAVADLRGVPWLLRRMVRSQFPDERQRAVLLDWDGALARRFAFERDACTILIVGPGGHVRLRTTTMTVDTVRGQAILREAAALTTALSSTTP